MKWKRLAKALIYGPPAAVRAGRNVAIKWPRKIEGARDIILGDDVLIAEHAWLATYRRYYDATYTPTHLRVGSGTQIGRYACITCIDSVVIGKNCLFSEYIFISDHAHGLVPGGGPLARQPLWSKGPVVIGDYCFLGYRAVVLPGVTLGEHCIVGANSVVTRSFPAFSMVGGVPARLLKRYCHSTQSWVETDDPGESEILREREWPVRSGAA